MARPNLNRPVPTGGTLPSGEGAVYGPKRSRQINRQIINDRRRRINAALRKKAAGINADRKAAARRQFQKDSQVGDYKDDLNYQRTRAGLESARTQALDSIESQRRGLGINYGLGQFGGDAATNPYSRAALLQKSYDQNQRRTQNAMAASGQLYSGATQSARDFNVGNYGQARDSLQKDFDARMGQADLSQAQALARYNSSLDAAQIRATRDAQKNKEANEFTTPVYRKPKLFKPKFRPLIKPINRPRQPNNGGVRP